MQCIFVVQLPFKIALRYPQTDRQTKTITTFLQDAELNKWLSEMESRYEGRRSKVDAICRNMGDRLKRKEKKIAKNLMIDPVHKLAYCRHGKVSLRYTIIKHLLSRISKGCY